MSKRINKSILYFCAHEAGAHHIAYVLGSVVCVFVVVVQVCVCVLVVPNGISAMSKVIVAIYWPAIVREEMK